MDFWGAQNQSKNKTILLSAFFIFGISINVQIFHHLASGLFETTSSLFELNINPTKYKTYTGSFLLIITAAGFIRHYLLYLGGGRAVAEAIGGKILTPRINSSAKQKQLLNVIQEMAIAAGAPIPPIYVLHDDKSINAFAAGITPKNSVICVTSGFIDNLNRDQMQGVIAHEFSHIINGDVKLNAALSVMISGLTLFSDRLFQFILRIFFDFKNLKERLILFFGAIFVLLLYAIILTVYYFEINLIKIIFSSIYILFLFISIFLIVGWLGYFAGHVMASAINRQREYFADAAAVQFTRNPEGIAGALERIGILKGLITLKKKKKNFFEHISDAFHSASNPASPYEHMMFSPLRKNEPLFWLFTSHPPLTERIRAIMPNWNISKSPLNLDIIEFADNTFGITLDAIDLSPIQDEKEARQQAKHYLSALLTSTLVKEQIGSITPQAISNAHDIIEKTNDIFESAIEDASSAQSLVFALVIGNYEGSTHKQQLDYLNNHYDFRMRDKTIHFIEPLKELSEDEKFSLLERSLTTLELMSKNQYHSFLDHLLKIAKMDGKISLFEWSILAITMYVLNDYFNKSRIIKKTIRSQSQQAVDAIGYALSILARESQTEPENAFASAVKDFKTNLAYNDSTFDLLKLYDAMMTIGQLSNKSKQQFIEAIVACVEHDGYINPHETILLRGYCCLLDCCLPLIVASDNKTDSTSGTSPKRDDSN